VAVTNKPDGTREKLSRTAGYYLAFVAFGLTVAALGPALPWLAEQTQSDLGQISILFTASALGFLLGAPLGGRLYDFLPGHLLMIASLVSMALAIFLVPFMPVLWLLVLLYLVIGTALGVLEVGCNTLLVWTYSQNLGPWLNGLHLFFGIGAVISPPIMARVVATSGDIDLGFWILAGIILIPAVWLVWLPSPSVRGSGDGQESAPPDMRLLLLITLIFLLYVGAEVSFGGWIYTYTILTLPGSEAMAGSLTSGFWAALTMGRLLAIPLSTRLTPRVILGLDFLGCILSGGLIIIWPDSVLVIWIATLGMGLSMASIFPTLLTFSERRMPITGTVSAWFFAGSGLGGMVLPWSIGQIVEGAGPMSVLVIILGAVVMAMAIFVGVVIFSSRSEKALMVPGR
jgi:FHS family Na+ dependent glucose MFS transporter 1